MMNNKDKLICATYAMLAIVALPATWINNWAFITQPHHNSIIDFVRAAYVNPAAASLVNDLLVIAMAACIFMVLEGRRVGVRFIWLYIVCSGLIAISVTFPLFLLARQIELAKDRSASVV